MTSGYLLEEEGQKYEIDTKNIYTEEEAMKSAMYLSMLPYLLNLDTS